MAIYSLTAGNVTNGNDNAQGTDQADLFEVTLGLDTYNGNGGVDSLFATGSYAHDVTFDMSTGAFSGSGDPNTKTLINFENYNASGLLGLNASTNAHDITGSSAANIIIGSTRNDRIYLSLGGDNLNGASGVDTLDASKLATNNGITLNLAANTISTGDIIANFENFVGTSLNDTIIGSDAANRLEGGAGNDIYFAGGGNDSIIDIAGNDVIVGGAGSDIASIGDASVTSYATGEILGAQANLLVFTRSDGSTATVYDSTERITANGITKSWVEWYGDYRQSLGQGGTDPDVPVTPETPGERLIGSNKKKDRLTGNAGNDYLDGRKLKDVLTGGDGADEFAFSKMQYGKKLRDSITDFDVAEGDKVLINGSKLGFLDASQIPFSVASNAQELSDALGSAVGLIYNQSNGDLIANLNGAAAGFGKGGIFANIGAGQSITNAEFGLI